MERGEFRDTAVTQLPQLLLAPMMVSMIWKILFAQRTLDTDKLMETHIEMVLAYIKT